MNNNVVNGKKNSQAWRWIPLGEACSFIGGGTPSKNEKRYWNGAIFWASVKDIKGQYLNSTEDQISELGLENSASNIAEPNDVILVTRISPGKTIITNVRTAINQDLKIVRPKFSTTPKFISYYFQLIERKLINNSSGTTVLGITLNNLIQIRIPILTLKHQQAIVSKIEELFSELDKGIENLLTAQQQLKTYRQSVLKWAFEGRLTNENVANGGLLGKWKWASLGEICDPTRKCSYGVLVPGEHIEDGVALLRIGDINEKGVIDQSSIKKISPTIASKFKRTVLQGGEVVMSLVGAIGRTAVVPESLKGGNTARAIGVIPVSKAVSAKFVEAMLRSPDKIREHNNSAHEVARKTLNLEDVIKSKIPLPLIEEQEQIVKEIESRLSVADKMEESITQSLNQAAALRQSILKKAFEGKLVIE